MRITHSTLLMALVALIPIGAYAQDTSALINEALDKTVNLKLDGMLPDVLKSIDAKTGVRIEPDRQVYQLLPWGEQTRVQVTVENQTLRQALNAITRKLGLSWGLGQFEVDLKPMPALARLGRRANADELAALDLLSSTPIELPKPGPVTAQAFIDTLDKQLAKIKSPSLAVELRAGEPSNAQAGVIKLDKTFNVPRSTTMAEALDALAEQSEATWYPWGRNIVVLPKQQQIRMRLNTPITTRWDAREIGDVLGKLSERSGVPFQIEPGALQRVPADYRTIHLEVENMPVYQVLDRIRGVTGLDYLIKTDGVYIWNQNPNPSVAARAGAVDPVVATLELDGGLQLFLRESQIPPDVREYLSRKEQDTIDHLRKRMKDEGFVPTTQPSSQSAGKEKDL